MHDTVTWLYLCLLYCTQRSEERGQNAGSLIASMQEWPASQAGVRSWVLASRAGGSAPGQVQSCALRALPITDPLESIFVFCPHNRIAALFKADQP